MRVLLLAAVLMLALGGCTTVQIEGRTADGGSFMASAATLLTDRSFSWNKDAEGGSSGSYTSRPELQATNEALALARQALAARLEPRAEPEPDKPPPAPARPPPATPTPDVGPRPLAATEPPTLWRVGTTGTRRWPLKIDAEQVTYRTPGNHEHTISRRAWDRWLGDQA